MTSVCHLPSIDSAEPATNLTVEDYGVSGTALHLLINSSIQFSGYLISRRLDGDSDQRSGDSCSAILRA